MIPTPATLFKYERPTVRSLQNLKMQSIFFASPIQFNDPYDCKIVPTIKEPNDDELQDLQSYFLSSKDYPPAVREAIETSPPDALRKTLVGVAEKIVRSNTGRFLKVNGVSCFAKENNNLLMWSHYCDSYKGYCLEFRTTFEPFPLARPVRYVDSMGEINVRDLFIKIQWQDLIDQLYCTKARVWSYEEEWRVIHQKAGTLYCYQPDALKAVYFGPEMDRETKEIICLILTGQNPNVEFWNAVRVPNRFELEFELFTYTSYADAKRLGLV